MSERNDKRASAKSPNCADPGLACYGHRVEPHTRDAPEVPPPGTVSGPRSCLIAGGAFLLFGLGSIAAAKLLIEDRNAEIIEAAGRLSQVIEAAGRAPGAAQLEAVGCEQRAVFTPADLKALARDLAAGRQQRQTKGASSADVEARVPEETVVVCATASNQPPTCAEVARAYAGAAPPAGTFVVTVQHPEGGRCAERFDAAAGPLGTTTTPNVPLLIDPK